MGKSLLVYFILLNVIAPLLITSVIADSLECPCNCGLIDNGDETLSSFLSNVRGKKGERGAPGSHGPEGLLGTAGKTGLPGLRGPAGSKGLSGISAEPLSSCADWKHFGHNQNGIYEIKTSNSSSPIQVYCDMEVDGGGWTLVASVHENNIGGKCTLGDNWSDNSFDQSDSNSWSNTRTFGNVDSVTSGDYKNSAYFNLPASDVMVWHVPNGNLLSEWSNQAVLKYYTNSSFLTQYGGSLQDLYAKNFPMEHQEKTSSGLSLEPILEMFNESSKAIHEIIPSFHQYKYDGPRGRSWAVRHIHRGGSMYSYGNYVYVRSGSESSWNPVLYGVTLAEYDTYTVSNNAKQHPFTTLMYIENSDGAEATYDLKVEGRSGIWYGRPGILPFDPYGKHHSYHGDISFKNYKMKYRVFNIYRGKGDPSICEVHYVIYNFKEWNSKISDEENFYQPVEWTAEVRQIKNHMRVSGNPRNILLGYTLFSRTGSNMVKIFEVKKTMRYMLQLISKYNLNEGIEPITNMLYDSSADICNMITEFNYYPYDGWASVVGTGMTEISNGGNDMYERGNKVYTRAGDGDWHTVIYGETYIGNPAYDVSSIMSHPFVTLMHIENPGGIEPTFDIKVVSTTHAYDSGAASSYDGDLILGDFGMKYKTYNVYAIGSSPSITEVYFVVYNFQKWKSLVDTDAVDFFKPILWSGGKDVFWTNVNRYLTNAMRVSGNPRNILFGYTLFSRTNSIPPNSGHVKDAMLAMLESVSKFDLTNGDFCSRLEESAVTPVQFHTGSPQDVANSIPPTQRLDTTAGYLQLRAVSPEGLPFAMCPGVKTESCSPSTVCIGGINSLKENAEACGDFTGYAGVPGDKPTETEPDGSAHSLKDIDSSILIFTRDSNTVSTKTSGY